MYLTLWFLRLHRAVIARVLKATWISIALVLLALFAGGAILLPILEGPNSAFQTLPGYTWWFIVTTTTVGYGDIAPETSGGRLVAVLIMVFGVGTLAVSVAKIAEAVLYFGRKRMKGLSHLDERDHLVIFGYHPDQTEELVDHIRADKTLADLPIVLCSRTADENPLPDKVKFIKGDLTSEDVLERASVATATRILVHCQDDNESLVVILAVRSVNRTAHIVAHLKKAATQTHIHRIDPEIECVRPLSIPLAVQAIQDRGATVIVSSLTDSRVDDTIFRLDIPPGNGQWTFGQLQHHFKKDLGATLVAVSSNPESYDVDLNPPYDSAVQAGESLFYIALERLEEKRINWGEI